MWELVCCLSINQHTHAVFWIFLNSFRTTARRSICRLLDRADSYLELCGYGQFWRRDAQGGVDAYHDNDGDDNREVTHVGAHLRQERQLKK